MGGLRGVDGLKPWRMEWGCMIEKLETKWTRDGEEFGDGGLKRSERYRNDLLRECEV